MNQSLLVKLDEIEAEMKKIAFWDQNPPDLRAEYARGERDSYLDSPSFELWLQCVFLPNAREAVETNSLPDDSQVGVMAMRQYDYHSNVPEAQHLVRLLHEFDGLVKRAARLSNRNG
jgi:uncharacterized protein YqcC (DUF446 family)